MELEDDMETEKSREPRPLLYRNMRRSNSSQLLMESILSEDSPPLPNYERLVQSQSMKSASADNDNDAARRPQKPAVQKLINYVFRKDSRVEEAAMEKDLKDASLESTNVVVIGNSSNNSNSTTAAAAAAAAGSSSNHEEHSKKKKRSSWLPDPEKRWPIQGWY